MRSRPRWLKRPAVRFLGRAAILRQADSEGLTSDRLNRSVARRQNMFDRGKGIAVRPDLYGVAGI